MGPKERDRARARPANGSYPETEGEMQTAKEEEQSSTTPSRATRHVERQPRSTGTAAHEELCVGIGPEPHLLNDRHRIRLFRIRHGRSTERRDLRSAKAEKEGVVVKQTCNLRRVGSRVESAGWIHTQAGLLSTRAAMGTHTVHIHTHGGSTIAR